MTDKFVTSEIHNGNMSTLCKRFTGLAEIGVQSRALSNMRQGYPQS